MKKNQTQIMFNTSINFLTFESAFSFILKEARFRLIWSILSFFLTYILCYTFSEELLFLLAKPFLEVVLPTNVDFVKRYSYPSFLFLSTRLTESLNTYLISSFSFAFAFCFPVLWYQVGCFFLPSLTCSQRKLFFECSRMSIFMLVLALCASFLFVLPSIYVFLYKCSDTSTQVFSIQMQPTVFEFTMLTLRFLFLSAFLSQSPLIIFYLIQLRTSFLQNCIKQRQRIWIICVLFSALFTPPDITCQLLCSLFMFFILEITFFYAYLQIHYKQFSNEFVKKHCPSG